VTTTSLLPSQNSPPTYQPPSCRCLLFFPSFFLCLKRRKRR
jgi:hypothetical protein